MFPGTVFPTYTKNRHFGKGQYQVHVHKSKYLTLAAKTRTRRSHVEHTNNAVFKSPAVKILASVLGMHLANIKKYRNLSLTLEVFIPTLINQISAGNFCRVSLVAEVAHVMYNAYAHKYTETGQNVELRTVSKCKASKMTARCIVYDCQTRNTVEIIDFSAYYSHAVK